MSALVLAVGLNPVKISRLTTKSLTYYASNRTAWTLIKQPTLHRTLLQQRIKVEQTCRSFSGRRFGELSTSRLLPQWLRNFAPKRQCSGQGRPGGPKLSARAQEREVNRKVIKSMLSYVWPKNRVGVRLTVILALSLLIGAKVVNIGVPFIFKHLVDYLNDKDNILNLKTPENTLLTVATALVLGYGLARAGAAGMNELRSAIFAKVAQDAIRRLARNVFRHLHNQDMHFQRVNAKGGLSKAIDRGTRGISTVLNALVFSFFPMMLEVTAVTGILFYKCGPQYAGVALACIGTYAVFTLRVTSWRTGLRKEMNKADQAAGSKSLDSLINYETVKYFNNEAYEVKRFDVELEKFEKASLKIARSLSFLNWGQNAIFSAGLAGMMYLASQGVISGSMTVGDIVMVNGLLFQLSIPLNFLGSIYRDFSMSLRDMEVMFNLMENNSSVQNKIGAPALMVTPQDSTVTFEDVLFQYEDGKTILNGLTFTVPAGKKVALVGGSGSGKSTIVRLLYRFYDPQQGRVLINGQDIKEVDIETVRKLIGVVPQESVLFHDSIYYNLQYGNLDATTEQVYAAARQADIHSTILSLPKKYETQVGERGDILSGGEKQRVSIARAILKNAPILVYDEATSSLDSITENKVLEALRWTEDRTTIVIAHRLSTVRDAHEILVLEKGRVAERGTHDQLIANTSSLYSQMWTKQNEVALEQNSNMSAAKITEPEQSQGA